MLQKQQQGSKSLIKETYFLSNIICSWKVKHFFLMILLSLYRVSWNGSLIKLDIHYIPILIVVVAKFGPLKRYFFHCYGVGIGNIQMASPSYSFPYC